MAAFDHKGRCLYANTPLASMLGYKLSVLRTKDISQLLPQPYGALHLKWIKVSVGCQPIDGKEVLHSLVPGICLQTAGGDSSTEAPINRQAVD